MILYYECRIYSIISRDYIQSMLSFGYNLGCHTYSNYTCLLLIQFNYGIYTCMHVPIYSNKTAGACACMHVCMYGWVGFNYIVNMIIYTCYCPYISNCYTLPSI